MNKKMIVACCFFTSHLQAATFCTLTATTVNFGTYNPLNASPTDATGTLTVTCNGTGVPFTLTLSTGSGTYATRTMIHTTFTLNYNLYNTVTHTTVWGDGSGATVDVTGNTSDCKNVSPCNITVFGRIPPSQLPQAGVYTDTIQASLSF